MRSGFQWKIDGAMTRNECLWVPRSEPWVDEFHPFKSLYYVIKVSLMETENKDLLIEGAKTHSYLRETTEGRLLPRSRPAAKPA